MLSNIIHYKGDTYHCKYGNMFLGIFYLSIESKEGNSKFGARNSRQTLMIFSKTIFTSFTINFIHRELEQI